MQAHLHTPPPPFKTDYLHEKPSSTESPKKSVLHVLDRTLGSQFPWNCKTAGGTRAKAWFTKSTVFCSLTKGNAANHHSAKRVYPYPLGAGSARPNPKRPRKPFISVLSLQLRGGLRPWSQTMVSEGARPWGRGRSGDSESRGSARNYYATLYILGPHSTHPDP